jgi:hypothetical protein
MRNIGKMAVVYGTQENIGGANVGQPAIKEKNVTYYIQYITFY